MRSPQKNIYILRVRKLDLYKERKKKYYLYICLETDENHLYTRTKKILTLFNFKNNIR